MCIVKSFAFFNIHLEMSICVFVCVCFVLTQRISILLKCLRSLTGVHLNEHLCNLLFVYDKSSCSSHSDLKVEREPFAYIFRAENAEK